MSWIYVAYVWVFIKKKKKKDFWVTWHFWEEAYIQRLIQKYLSTSRMGDLHLYRCLTP